MHARAKLHENIAVCVYENESVASEPCFGVYYTRYPTRLVRDSKGIQPLVFPTPVLTQSPSMQAMRKKKKKKAGIQFNEAAFLNSSADGTMGNAGVGPSVHQHSVWKAV